MNIVIAAIIGVVALGVSGFTYYQTGNYGGEELFGAISFPTSLDTFTNPSATDKTNSPSHSTQHSNANDAVEALEAKVGADSSAVTTSHDYKLSGVTGSDKACSVDGTETLTNKTLTRPNIYAIDDLSGNEWLEVIASSSAVNQFAVGNSATGGSILLTASGTDANIDTWLYGKGSGDVNLGAVPHVWPSTDGTNGQVLQTNGAGALSFVSAGGINSTTTASSSLPGFSVDGSDTVLVIAKGNYTGSASQSTINLYWGESTVVDTVVGQMADAGDDLPFTLTYLATPSSTTTRVWMEVPVGRTLNNPDITILKF